MTAIERWFKSLSPAVQSLLYAIETGVATVIIVFLGTLYSAMTSPQGLAAFAWHTQLYTLAMGAGAAIIKAIIDFLKGNAPSQIPPTLLK